MVKKSVAQTATKVWEKKYETTMALWYNEAERQWQIGEFLSRVFLTPSLAITPTHNINSITIHVVNRGHSKDHNNFSMAIDSVGQDSAGGPILFSKYYDAVDQLDKNKSNLEKFLSANVDISVLKTLHPIMVEFEKRADGKTTGHNELQID